MARSSRSATATIAAEPGQSKCRWATGISSWARKLDGQTVQHRDGDLTALAGLPSANVLRVIEDRASKLA